MFDFEILEVYKKAKGFNAGIRQFLKEAKLDSTTIDQLRRASFSIVLNLAEGSGRFSKPDRRNFFVVARSSVFGLVNHTLQKFIEMNTIDYPYIPGAERIFRVLQP